MINLIRCDDRLIHGQCMTRLVQHFFIKNIIVVDDFTASNSIMKLVFEKSAMPGMENKVFSAADAPAAIREAVDNKIGTMIVFRFPETAKKIFEEVDNLPKTLMVGPVQKRDGCVSIMNGTYVTPDELKIFEELDQKGVDVYFQTVPDMKKLEWKEIKKKYL